MREPEQSLDASDSQGPAEHQSDPARRRRLRWRARRGLLENDLIFSRFLDVHETQLSDADVVALDQLLELGDNDLLDLVLARRPLSPAIDTPAVHAILKRLGAEPGGSSFCTPLLD